MTGFVLVRARARVLDLAVCGALAVSDATLRVVGLERALRWAGAAASWAPGTTGASNPVEGIDDLGRARLALVGAVMRRRALWTRTDGPCLRQALLVSALLRRHHPVVHLGVARGEAGPLAHAWVTVGQVRIGFDPAYASFTGVAR